MTAAQRRTLARHLTGSSTLCVVRGDMSAPCQPGPPVAPVRTLVATREPWPRVAELATGDAGYRSRMLVAVFGDAHAHAEALGAVIRAAEGGGADELWSLGDMIGAGPDPERAVAITRAHCTVALLGNHDYGATGGVELERFGRAESANARSIVLARERLPADDVAWMRTRRPAARRHGVHCWHGSPRNAVWEYVGPSNAAACLTLQRAELGLVAHTHLAAAFRQTSRRAHRVAIRLASRSMSATAAG